MTEMKVSDEMLMAYADGELDRNERETIAALAVSDPAIAARIARFAGARQAVRDAFAPVLAEPVPDALIATITGAPKPARPAAYPFSRFAMPLAASLVVAAGLGGYLFGQSSLSPEPTSFLAAATSASVLNALAATPAGEPVRVASSSYDIEALATGTYEVAGGICRTYEAGDADAALRGVACTDGASWQVPVTTLAPSATYRPAEDPGTTTIDAFLDSLGAGPDIGADAEAALIARDWNLEP
ncbi:anti-sigma factor family protein [Pelagibacterium luteolum]|uniref:Transmembrane transcriptional regulator (Anti-sigma factor RsiW) n=1 Tax=Pelagibacterium luteolum TaxID=440168 RepID=A0A1G7TQ63_9HYPH|nr:hypothetical protein [Pelagibacterium luteolum]SDG37361.1 hypothetical protein SAMN04487974_102269 [Pelagibacterium luteolum]